MDKPNLFLLISMLLILNACDQQSPRTTFQSPDSRFKSSIWKDSSGYKIQALYKDIAYLEEGRLGLIIKDCPELFTKITSVKGPFFKEAKFDVTGVHNSASVHWNEYHIGFKHGEEIELRLFENGLAYRYKVDQFDSHHVVDEKSSWTIPAETKVWFFERENHWKLKSYAGEWMSADIGKLAAVSKNGPIQGKPLIFEFKNGKVGFLSEAALYNFSGLRFHAIGSGRLRANFSEGAAGFSVSGKVKTPWRVFSVFDDLNDVINQDIVLSLNPQPDSSIFKELDWIKPGKSVWRWWSKGTGSPSQEMEMIDYAKELGFEYTLIDAGWEQWPDKWEKLRKVCAYAKSKDVGVWVWKHSNELNIPEDDFSSLKHFLDSISNAGVSGIKVDFMNGETKSLIDFDVEVLKQAAYRKLMVNFHGCQASTGEARTYPNELTREGIRGAELNLMSEGPVPASHNSALPFTRFIVGHADYTPLVFSSPGSTTWAHQLATLVAFTSPLQVIAENPKELVENPTLVKALPFIKEVPAVWDETIVLPESKIGEIAAIARRSGQDWYIGILNGGDKRSYNLDISGLKINADRALLFSDSPIVISNPIDANNYQNKLHYARQIIPFTMDTVDISKRSVAIELERHGGAVLLIKE